MQRQGPRNLEEKGCFAESGLTLGSLPWPVCLPCAARALCCPVRLLLALNEMPGSSQGSVPVEGQWRPVTTPVGPSWAILHLGSIAVSRPPRGHSPTLPLRVLHELQAIAKPLIQRHRLAVGPVVGAWCSPLRIRAALPPISCRTNAEKKKKPIFFGALVLGC